jgi:anti-sigma B factor antagonist
MRPRGPISAAVEEFRIYEERSPAGTVVLVLRGEADLHVAPAVRDRLLEAVSSGASAIVVDLTDVTFVDSMMLGALLGALKRMQGSGEFRVVVSSREIRRLFEITLLDRVFSLDQSREAALQAIEQPAA